MTDEYATCLVPQETLEPDDEDEDEEEEEGEGEPGVLGDPEPGELLVDLGRLHVLDDDGDGAEGGALAHRVRLLRQHRRAVRRVPRAAGERLVEHRAPPHLDLYEIGLKQGWRWEWTKHFVSTTAKPGY